MAKSVFDVYRENLGQAVVLNVGALIFVVVTLKFISDRKEI